MKKYLKILKYVVLILIIALFLYKAAGSYNLKKITYEYFETRGCLKEDIKKIKVKHSLINLIVSYQEWKVEVNLDDRYTINFNYDNKKLVLSGINNEELTKESLQKILEKVEDGTICNFESEFDIQNNEVSVEILEYTDTSMTYLLKNHTNNSYTYGEAYSIEYEKDGAWYYLKPIIENYGFTLIGYNLEPNQSREKSIDWEWLYGKLEIGKYRIIETLYLNSDGPAPNRLIITGNEFIIED